MVDSAGSEPLDVLEETWVQKVKRKVGDALAGFGHGGRPIGDRWPRL